MTTTVTITITTTWRFGAMAMSGHWHWGWQGNVSGRGCVLVGQWHCQGIGWRWRAAVGGGRRDKHNPQILPKSKRDSQTWQEATWQPAGALTGRGSCKLKWQPARANERVMKQEVIQQPASALGGNDAMRGDAISSGILVRNRHQQCVSGPNIYGLGGVFLRWCKKITSKLYLG